MKIKISLLLLCISIFTGCGKYTTKGEAFPLVYEQKPLSILILPPINESTAADAKDYYATTIQEPVVSSGYYVFPYEVSAEILKAEGLYDSELLRDASLHKFKEFFGADAVLFTKIKRWDLSYIVLSSQLTVSIDCQLKSTTTNEILWNYNGTIVADLSGNNNQAGMIGLIGNIVSTAIKSAVADYVPYARICTYKATSSLPYGRYHERHLQDHYDEILIQRDN